MRLPNVPGTYTPRIEAARNQALRAADRANVKKTGEQVLEGALDVKTLKVDGAEIAQAAAQADSTASDVAGIVSDFNALLAKLRAAGLLGS